MGPSGRIHNFGAGPAVLPLEVVEEVAETLPNLDGSGFGLMEVSHRSQTFQDVIDSAMSRLRGLIPSPMITRSFSSKEGPRPSST